MVVTKLVGARVYFDKGPLLRLTFDKAPAQDFRLSVGQLQVLGQDTIDILLSRYECQDRAKT